MPEPKSPQTIAASNGIGSDAAFGAVTPPLYLTTTFAFEGFDREGAYAYTRQGNPTRDLLADTLAKLEGGAGAVVTASGMAAIDLVLSQMEPDDLIIAPHGDPRRTWTRPRSRARAQAEHVRRIEAGRTPQI
jgi:cystathionine gamma-synthase